MGAFDNGKIKKIFITATLFMYLKMVFAQTRTDEIVGHWKLKSQWLNNDKSFFIPHKGVSVEYIFKRNGDFLFSFYNKKISEDTSFQSGKWRLTEGKIYLYDHKGFMGKNRVQPYEIPNEFFNMKLSKSRLLINGESLVNEVDSAHANQYVSEYVKINK